MALTDQDHTYLNDVTFGDGRFVAVGLGVIYTSLDGVQWSKAVSGVVNDMKSVTYGSDQFVAVGARGAMRSEDGENNFSYYRLSVCYGNDQFVALGPYEVSISTSGNKWEDISFSKDRGGYLEEIAYGDGRFIASGGIDDTGDTLWTSMDGVHWKEIIHVKDHIHHIKCIHGYFYLLSGRPILFTKDGQTWTRKMVPTDRSLSDIAYGNYLREA